MRRSATKEEKAAWRRMYGIRLIGFIPCVGGDPKDVVHQSVIQRTGKNNTYIRLCDLIGSWKPASGIVDCMTCIVAMRTWGS